MQSITPPLAAGVTDCQEVNCPKGKRGHPGVRRFAPRNDNEIWWFSYTNTPASIPIRIAPGEQSIADFVLKKYFLNENNSY